MPLFRYEHRKQPMLTPAQFAGRLAVNLLVALGFIGVVLVAGMAGYRATGIVPCDKPVSWVDAFINASMILGGMGPVDAMCTDAGKLFAGSYALVCGLVIVAATAVILAPVLHRVMHAMHVDDKED